MPLLWPPACRQPPPAYGLLKTRKNKQLEINRLKAQYCRPPNSCRGKLLNVRDASSAQITGNAEIQNIKQILGLQHGKVYTDSKSLRYGHLMIMTDQVGRPQLARSGWPQLVRARIGADAPPARSLPNMPG